MTAEELKAIRERALAGDWPLSFSHRAAETLDEMREVLAVLAEMRSLCIERPDDLSLLRIRNAVWGNVEGYGDQYVAQLLAAIDEMEPYLKHDAGCPQTWETSPKQACDCGLDELLKTLEGR